MQREGFEGRTVVSVIEDFRSQGWSFAYSTNLVSDDLLVIAEPEDSDVLDIVRQILVPHGLTLRSEEGLWLIVRDNASAARLGSLSDHRQGSPQLHAAGRSQNRCNA